jgi:hypothetical protein
MIISHPNVADDSPRTNSHDNLQKSSSCNISKYSCHILTIKVWKVHKATQEGLSAAYTAATGAPKWVWALVAGGLAVVVVVVGFMIRVGATAVWGRAILADARGRYGPLLFITDNRRLRQEAILLEQDARNRVIQLTDIRPPPRQEQTNEPNDEHSVNNEVNDEHSVDNEVNDEHPVSDEHSVKKSTCSVEEARAENMSVL